MTRHKHKQPAAFPAILRRVVALALAFWLLMSGLLTWAVAADMYRQMELQVTTYLWGESHERTPIDSEALDLPGAMEYNSITELNLLYYRVRLEPLLPFVEFESYLSGVDIENFNTQKREPGDVYEVAALYYDESGQILWQNGKYLSFTYTDEKNWKAGKVAAQGYGYVNLDEVEGGVEVFEHVLNHDPKSQVYASYMFPVLRLTGYTGKDGFHPMLIERGEVKEFSKDYASLDALNDLDRLNDLEWVPMLDAQGETELEIKTIYAWEIGGIISEENAVTSGGMEFATLSELLYEDCISEESYSRNNLWDAIIVRVRTGERDKFGSFNFAVAVRCRPMEYAMRGLIWFYLASFVMTVVAVGLVLYRIRLKLTRPLARMTKAVREKRPLTPYINPHAHWREPYELESHILQLQADCEQKDKELAQGHLSIARLDTALEYAKNAEKNRKQLVSDLTHELKTPLAVIHSYAEGLQAGIAEEKREQYLNVLLEETERMDAMVLQMLDLSRLEAGKVKLATDEVWLLTLAQSVTSTFAPMLEEKGLELSFDPAQEVNVLADEYRIRQVITNLISNAHKYTLPGGKIRVKIFREGDTACFFVENTAKLLSETALEKVWESFYRVESSRAETGTGLGLTLVKNIVELHQGRCLVNNLEQSTMDPEQTAVEFGFTLPIR